MALVGTVYVVTCGQCGQIWQRTTVSDGQPVECIFCGHRGRLCLGALPDPQTTAGASRVEAWLPY